MPKVLTLIIIKKKKKIKLKQEYEKQGGKNIDFSRVYAP